MRKHFFGPTSCFLCGLVLGLCAATAVAAEDVAAQVDALLAGESFGASRESHSQPAGRVDDETFLRRLSLDLIGELPSPAEITSFVLDPNSRKRAGAVEHLLANEHFGQNWARYWRDVIFYRRTEDRALVAAPALLVYLTQQFNRNVAWDKIARQFITASGDVTQQGNTAVIMAQMADPADTAAEMSRIFVGIQIQCAQCHNHPTDRWKREQFHELAAFFPRIGIRPTFSAQGRTFSVVSLDRPRNKRAPGATGGTDTEHYMPDLNDLQAKGTLIEPVFFATGQKLPLGLTDLKRREVLARWLTAPQDEWFAKAFVNRIWAELVGRGFYEPVDDLGPDRECSAPKTLEYLSTQFVAHRYDVKWLFRTITATEAYQRAGRSRHDASTASLAASCPQRLRGDQLFNALTDALAIEEESLMPRAIVRPRQALAGPRGQVNRAFGYDPSSRREEVSGSIPQALFLMNSPFVNRGVSARQPENMLAQLLATTPSDESAISEIYLRCLAREPQPREVSTCLAYIGASRSRGEAFEDIVWSLLNSTEFLYRK